MTRDDWETSESLLPVFIEIGKEEKGRLEPDPNRMAYVNVGTFKDCFQNLTRESSRYYNREIRRGSIFYSVYSTTCFRALSGGVNIDHIPLSRTLIGYLEEGILRENLPKTWGFLNEE